MTEFVIGSLAEPNTLVAVQLPKHPACYWGPAHRVAKVLQQIIGRVRLQHLAKQILKLHKVFGLESTDTFGDSK
eukprot:CAMPEP_0172843254 /NCGR_PEP_ID=MMETSP1075-20121228/31331_1 /TAXON_ID=2916 /ORGANISM="Ceratium fusus, Strain PA161109" /LENGTH=73 /DNA_ID=CAMNT_0013687495 /DNA_START=214 /DNA_END=432 /DNA_ORIENTATION=+